MASLCAKEFDSSVSAHTMRGNKRHGVVSVVAAHSRGGSRIKLFVTETNHVSLVCSETMSEKELDSRQLQLLEKKQN